MTKDKLRVVMKAFIDSQFNYCPLIWMFHSRNLNNRINRLHKRALKIAYNNYNSTFVELLLLDKSVSIHDRNLKKLATEMFKIKNKIFPLLIQNLFKNYSSKYDLRNKRCWEMYNINTVNYGMETIIFRGPKIWDLLPAKIKESSSLVEFKLKIKSWKPKGCTCRLCKIYIHDLGFLY